MKTVTATEMKQNFGTYLMSVSGEPITITKSNKPVAILINYNEYQRLINIEDKMLLEEAKIADKEGYLNENETDLFIKCMNNRYL